MKPFFWNTGIAWSLIALLHTPLLADAAASPSYTVTDLGILPGASSSLPTALNDRAQVVGVCSTGGQGRAFLWEKGRMHTLPVLPGFDSLSLWPRAINNAGKIVGTDFGPKLDTRRAFIYDHGVTRDLGTPAGEYSEATDINDKNRVIGKSYTIVIKNNVEHYVGMSYTFVWNPATGFQKLNPSSNDFGEGVSAINNMGQIVGASWNIGVKEAQAKRAALPPEKRPYEGNEIPSAAFLWQNGRIQSISPPQAWSSGSVAINEQGDILGSMSLYPDSDEVLTSGAEESAKIEDAMRHSHHVFLWRNGQAQDLGELGIAGALNNAGDVVGYTRLDNGRGYRAFLWRAGKQYMLTDLISPSDGWILTEATAINNHGQIIGIGRHHGLSHAFLLTPR